MLKKDAFILCHVYVCVDATITKSSNGDDIEEMSKHSVFHNIPMKMDYIADEQYFQPHIIYAKKT